MGARVWMPSSSPQTTHTRCHLLQCTKFTTSSCANCSNFAKSPDKRRGCATCAPNLTNNSLPCSIFHVLSLYAIVAPLNTGKQSPLLLPSPLPYLLLTSSPLSPSRARPLPPASPVCDSYPSSRAQPEQQSLPPTKLPSGRMAGTSCRYGWGRWYLGRGGRLGSFWYGCSLSSHPAYPSLIDMSFQRVSEFLFYEVVVRRRPEQRQTNRHGMKRNKSKGKAKKKKKILIKYCFLEKTIAAGGACQFFYFSFSGGCRQNSSWDPSGS